MTERSQDTAEMMTAIPGQLPAASQERVVAAATISPFDIEPMLNRRLLRLDARIRNQFDLITSRTGWLLTSHAFLLAAVAATIDTSSTHFEVPSFGWIRWVLLLGLPLIGLITSYFVWRSVMGAYSIVAKVKSARLQLLERMFREFRYELTDGGADDVMAGDRPPKVFPWLLGAVWLAILMCTLVGLLEHLVVLLRK